MAELRWVGSGLRQDLVPTDEEAISVAEVATLYTADAESRDLLQRAVRTTALPQGWRDYFRTRLWQPTADYASVE